MSSRRPVRPNSNLAAAAAIPLERTNNPVPSGLQRSGSSQRELAHIGMRNRRRTDQAIVEELFLWFVYTLQVLWQEFIAPLLPIAGRLLRFTFNVTFHGLFVPFMRFAFPTVFAVGKRAADVLLKPTPSLVQPVRSLPGPASVTFTCPVVSPDELLKSIAASPAAATRFNGRVVPAERLNELPGTVIHMQGSDVFMAHRRDTSTWEGLTHLHDESTRMLALRGRPTLPQLIGCSPPLGRLLFAHPQSTDTLAAVLAATSTPETSAPAAPQAVAVAAAPASAATTWGRIQGMGWGWGQPSSARSSAASVPAPNTANHSAATAAVGGSAAHGVSGRGAVATTLTWDQRVMLGSQLALAVAEAARVGLSIGSLDARLVGLSPDHASCYILPEVELHQPSATTSTSSLPSGASADLLGLQLVLLELLTGKTREALLPILPFLAEPSGVQRILQAIDPRLPVLPEGVLMHVVAGVAQLSFAAAAAAATAATAGSAVANADNLRPAMAQAAAAVRVSGRPHVQGVQQSQPPQQLQQRQAAGIQAGLHAVATAGEHMYSILSDMYMQLLTLPQQVTGIDAGLAETGLPTASEVMEDVAPSAPPLMESHGQQQTHLAPQLQLEQQAAVAVQLQQQQQQQTGAAGAGDHEDEAAASAPPLSSGLYPALSQPRIHTGTNVHSTDNPATVTAPSGGSFQGTPPPLRPAIVTDLNLNMPTMFMCPLTHDAMVDPVVAEDGFTYERTAIQEWLQRHRRSPMTNMPMQSTALVPNHLVRSAIREWQDTAARAQWVSGPPPAAQVPALQHAQQLQQHMSHQQQPQRAI